MRVTPISCVRRLRIGVVSVVVAARSPTDFDEPVDVEVRFTSFLEDWTPYTGRLKWKREWSEEQRADDKPFVDSLGAFAAAELALAALGGERPSSVELLSGPPPEDYGSLRRVLAFCIAAAAADAALTGERPRLSDEAVSDYSEDPA